MAFAVIGVLAADGWISARKATWNALRIWMLAEAGWYGGPEMVEIPSGEFMMGSPEPGSVEVPQHRVTIARPFRMGKYEVTFDEYAAYALATGLLLPRWGRGKRPVINVSWDDAQAYAQWLTEVTGKRYRLPTEAEWEYAARAGTTTDYWWGNEVREGGRVWANCSGCGSEWDGLETAPVGSFAANGFGLHDTAGNVWEWVEDCWHEYYEGASRPDDGKAWLEADGGNCGHRMVRGGSWGGIPAVVRSAMRGGLIRANQNPFLGFRLAQDL